MKTHPANATILHHIWLAALAWLSLLLLLFAGGRAIARTNQPEAAAAVSMIYWTDQAEGNQSGEIWRVGADGNSGLEKVVDGLNGPRGVSLDIDNNRMYWVDRFEGLIQRANLDGSNRQTICSGLSNVDDLALDIDAGMMYWTEPARQRISRSSMNNCNSQILLGANSGLNAVVGIALDLTNNKLYWTEFDTKRVKRANLDGSNPETLPITPALLGPLELALDPAGGVMYLVDSAPNTSGSGGRIIRVPLSGGNFTTIVSNLDNPRGIDLDLDQGHIYWIDFGTQALQRSDLNGSNQVTLKSGGISLDDPRSLTLDRSGNGIKCYPLSLERSGAGSFPVAFPTSSPGCDSGSYVNGANINLTASPASGWSVGSWSGTNFDSSTSVNNTATMPDHAHSVTVHYIEPTPTSTPCYLLVRTHTGEGSDPIASPPSSPGCPGNHYTAGATINLTAAPAANYEVGSWSGTNFDSSTSLTNNATMPAGSHTIIVHYIDKPTPCHPLLLQRVGSGSIPIAAPPSSAECPLGQYIFSETITLIADPAPQWEVERWTGTLNDNSQSLTNTVLMSNGPHTATVYYKPPECYQLALSHEGQGGDPVPSPSNSEGCNPGSYGAGAAVTLTADPAPNYEVLGWSGTIDDASAASSNFAIMPAGSHRVSVRYGFVQPPTFQGYLPFAITQPTEPPPCYPGEAEIEPNNNRALASFNGAFCLGRVVRGLPTDQWDVFAYDLDRAGTLTVVVSNHRGNKPVLYLSNIDGAPLDIDEVAADGLRVTYSTSVPVRVFAAIHIPAPNPNETTPYTLQTTFE